MLPKYIGQCDKLRQTELGERYWQKMMSEKHQISQTQFMDCVKFEMISLLDDGETVKGYFKGCKLQDPELSFYVSKWGDSTCYFFQTCGFEFVFSYSIQLNSFADVEQYTFEVVDNPNVSGVFQQGLRSVDCGRWLHFGNPHYIKGFIAKHGLKIKKGRF